MESILSLSQIQESYENYLNHFDEEYKRKKALEKNKETHFSASGAGLCIKKNIFKIRGYDKTNKNDLESKATMRLGNIFGSDIQSAVVNKKFNPAMNTIENLKVYQEYEIEIPEYRVKGFLDIFAIIEEAKIATIKDFKTIKAWAWRRKFGRKENRDLHPSDNYEYQIGTYALAIKTKYPDIQFVNNELIYLRKDDSKFKAVKVEDVYMDMAEEYWMEVNRINEMANEVDDLELGIVNMCPVYEWECKLCDWRKICPSPFKGDY